MFSINVMFLAFHANTTEKNERCEHISELKGINKYNEMLTSGEMDQIISRKNSGPY